jgi:hypothetical protein
MTSQDITRHRLINQQLAATDFTTAASLVQWMGCIQAQDFAGAKWAIGSRLGHLTDAVIERDFNEGRFLRTHVLRPTWHFVAPEDIRWMLRLTAPRIKNFNKNLHRNLDITAAVLKRSTTLIEKALTGGHHLTRQELAAVLKKARINTDDIRLAFLLMEAELNGVICSGPRKGKQFTYALLEERVPPAAVPGRQESLGALARRYFLSRGPATLPDFAWWGGLTLRDAREGLEQCSRELANEVVNGQAYWFSAGMSLTPAAAKGGSAVYLLPAYDEYAIGYKDRSDILPAGIAAKAGNGIFKPILIAHTRMAGVWQRELAKDAVTVKLDVFEPLGQSAERRVKAVMKRYGKFLGKKVV